MAWSIAELARDSGVSSRTLRHYHAIGLLAPAWTADHGRSTIENLREGGEMTPKQVFEGFEHNPYEAEARERWGDAAVDFARERVRDWTPEQAELARTVHTRVHEGLAPLLSAGVPVTDERVQSLVALHHRAVSLVWTPDAEAYRGLARMYVDDERFHQAVGGGDPELVGYLRDAIDVYADTRL